MEKHCGGIIDGCPSGIEIDLEAIQFEMSRRKPGQSAIVTQGKNRRCSVLMGIFEGKRQEHLLVLLFQIQIKNRMIISYKRQL
jgi:chorismate synthase